MSYSMPWTIQASPSLKATAFILRLSTHGLHRPHLRGKGGGYFVNVFQWLNGKNFAFCEPPLAATPVCAYATQDVRAMGLPIGSVAPLVRRPQSSAVNRRRTPQPLKVSRISSATK